MSAGFVPATIRTTSNLIVTVLQGSSRTEADGITIDWSSGDVVAMLAWRPYRHAV